MANLKFLAFVGSLRKGSFNRMVFDHYREKVVSGVELLEAEFHDFPLYNDDVKANAFPDPVLRVGEQIKNANGVLFFSPEYNYSVPGALKNMLDWISRLPDQPLAGKPASIISASPGKLGGARMQYHLRQIGVFLDLKIMNKPEVMISEVNKKVSADGKLTDEDTAKFLKSHFAKFVEFAGHGA